MRAVSQRQQAHERETSTLSGSRDKLRMSKPLDEAPADNTRPDVIAAWFAKLKVLLAPLLNCKEPLRAQDVWHRRTVLHGRGRQHEQGHHGCAQRQRSAEALQGDASRIATTLLAINAAAGHAPCVLIFKAKNVPAAAVPALHGNRRKGQFDLSAAANDSGYMTDGIFYYQLNGLAHHARCGAAVDDHTPWPVFFMDGHGTHATPRLRHWAAQNRVVIIQWVGCIRWPRSFKCNGRAAG